MHHNKTSVSINVSAVASRSAAAANPFWQRVDRGTFSYYIAPQMPHWCAVDRRSTVVMDQLCAGVTGSNLVSSLALEEAAKGPQAELHMRLIEEELREKEFLDHDLRADSEPLGRSSEIPLETVQELWVHTNQNCNLSCSHCLVQSGPSGDRGADLGTLKEWIQQGLDLGVQRVYCTGGEPFARADILELIHYVTVERQAELIVLTNGTLLSRRILDGLQAIPRDRLRFQISLDGTTAAVHDSIRGTGSFAKVCTGIPALVQAGFAVSLTMVPLRSNALQLVELPALAASLGAGSVHLMWPHRRGWLDPKVQREELLPVEDLEEIVVTVLERCHNVGIDLDNYGAVLYRVNGQPGLRYDLSNAGWDSLFIDEKGEVYPSPVFAGEAEMACGSLTEQGLEEIWRNSSVLKTLRSFTSADFTWLQDSPLRWLLGGGDLEQIWYAAGRKLAIDVPDPYYRIQERLAWHALHELAKQGEQVYGSNGYTGPKILHVMGDGSIHCGTEGYQQGSRQRVRTMHSNCVLSFDVDKPRSLMRAFYGAAAVEPQAELCCPVRYDDALISHIPQAVLDRFYGCGSPVGDAALQSGERYLDLGSGAGIDVFTAARLVGPQGKAMGVDMTTDMLAVARDNQSAVANNLGWDNMQFLQGFLENIPVPDGSVDVLTSNCVINLSPDKRAVLGEMWRVLDQGGRFCISDIVSEKRVPPHLRVNSHLWGECISGALTERELYLGMIKAGFYGITIRRKSFWKEVDGYSFLSITVAGYKIRKDAGCVYNGQRAIYNGPFMSVTDEEGHLFPRGEAIEICTDTAFKLSRPPYNQNFILIDAQGVLGPLVVQGNAAESGAGICVQGSGCC